MVQERLWIEHHHPPHHPHPRTDLMCAKSPENGFGKDQLDSPESSDSEDLHYGPGIVNRLRNKYLSLALRESNSRPTILRKATSLENLLDDDGEEDGGEKENGRLFSRRSAGNEGNRYRSSNRRQEMKRARSVEVISRTNHEEDLTMTSSVTAKINNRQSLHEDMLIQNPEEKEVIIEKQQDTRSYKKPVSIENGTEDTDKYTRRINRPKRIPPLLNEREKPPVDVVKHAKMIFEKRPETRTKKPHHTGDVAAKVDSFQDIIVKTKVALKSTKQTIKNSKPVLTDKCKSNTHRHHARPVAKPVVLSEEKPKTLELGSPKLEKNGFNTLPSPIPDVSRVDIKNQDGDPRNNSNSLCETPDLILTSSPLPKITSPTYRKRTTEDFIQEERKRSFLGLPTTDATNKYISPIHSPTKTSYNKPTTINFNREDLDSLGIKMISPISQNNITKSSATSVFNFLNSQVDQRHLPLSKRNSSEIKSPNSEVNGFGGGGKIKMGISAFEMEKNLKNAAKEAESPIVESVEKSKKVGRDKEKLGQDVVGTNPNNIDKSWQNIGCSVEKTSSIFENLSKNGKSTNKPTEEQIIIEKTETAEDPPKLQVEVETETLAKVVKLEEKPEVIEKIALKPVQVNKSASDKNSAVVDPVSDEKVKIVLPKKTKPKQEESTTAVFNFTSRRDVPDYISNDTSRSPSRPVIPKPDEPGIKLLPDALISNLEIQEVWEEDELIRSLEARPPSPCDVTFINDNVLIDGKSSLIQPMNKRLKMKISFVDDAEIYEYPSETSLLLDDSPLSPLGGVAAQVGHSTPILSGSSLATYTPKTREDFQLGITKSFQEPVATLKQDVVDKAEDKQPEVLLEEVESPVLFSSGSTSDILF